MRESKRDDCAGHLHRSRRPPMPDADVTDRRDADVASFEDGARNVEADVSHIAIDDDIR